MFGGADKWGVLAETWTWDGTGWLRQHPRTSPPAREFAYMGYDPATSRVVLFGGTSCAPPAVDAPIGCEYQQAQTTMADTWTWDGAAWSQLKTAHSPSIKYFRGPFGAMDGDLSHRNLILVTWSPPIAGQPVETWTLQNGDWQRLQPKDSPPAEDVNGPAYDAVSGRLILKQLAPPHYAYRSNGILPAALPGDRTWSWDGSDWRDLGPSVNSPHVSGDMVSVGRHGLLLMAGGGAFAWNGKSWGTTPSLPESVSFTMRPRAGFSAAYHEPSQELVLVGGRAGAGSNHLMADTAGWDGTTWKTLVPAPLSPKVPLSLCSAKAAESGTGAGFNADRSGASVEVDFFEPPSGPCHLHVDVVLTLVRGNDSPLQMPGNPRSQPVDADLTWDAGGLAVTFEAPGVCAFPPGIMARIQAGDLDQSDPLVLYQPCQMVSPPPPSITSSVRNTGLRP